MEYREVALREINFRDERFRTSYFFDLDALVDSIKRVGLVSPPLLCRRGGAHVLATGWKRALACRRLGIRAIPALITPERADRRLLLRAVSENAVMRPFDLAEKSEIVRKLLASGESASAVIRRHLPRLSLPPTRFHLGLLSKLARAPEPIRRFVGEQGLGVSQLETLFRFSREDQKLLLPFLGPLGLNKQKEALDHLSELRRRDGVTVRGFLDRKEAREILRSGRMSSLQKAEKIRERLLNLRFPELCGRREAFRRVLGRVPWPKGVSVRPSPFMEEEEIAFSFELKGRAELKEAARGLALAADDPELDALFPE